MPREISKVEYSAKDKDGNDVTGMVRTSLNAVEELREAIRYALAEAGFDVVDIEIHGIIPSGETRLMQTDAAGDV